MWRDLCQIFDASVAVQLLVKFARVQQLLTVNARINFKFRHKDALQILRFLRGSAFAMGVAF